MKIKIFISRILIPACMAVALMPVSARALPETNRSLLLGSSAASAVTTYAFSFKPGTGGNIGAIKFELCDSPVESISCVNSGNSSGASFTSNSASIQSQSGISGFTAGTGGGGSPPAPTANTFWITNGTPQNVLTSTQVTVTFQNVRNPSASNVEFYGRITTYTNSDGTGEVDFGAAAVGTTQQITVSGNMPESLVFCVGTSITSDCTTISGSSVNLGTFSPLITNTGTSVMQASTNASFGYTISINGTTMTSGLNTIPAMGTQTLNSAGCSPSCTSSAGTSQFGSNVRANNLATASPNSFGADVSGAGGASGSGGYNGVNSFRFFSGDTVASVNGPTKANTFTNSYIVNVGGDQAAGQYTATMTYICTATF